MTKNFVNYEQLLPSLPTLYLETVAAFIPSSIVVFIMSPHGMGCPCLSRRQEKAESQNNMFLITIKHKFVTYNSEE
jgi:hypothetical protein